ncbi:MAG: replication protein C [Acidiphilium sp. 37-64-53]|uniref:plasmid replication protein RepC n=1 Tax=unclassified Acidiphilium TaxID=2617493 RepID=UPI000BC85BE6|nr:MULTISPECIES: plasmid replication protein RepC [unclassified Acidiphilium]OYW00765.1 MAG: replication protein C [Acidiphilium sp. 37-64-53]OZB23119.1 MAG: replication protein C [Acidiphilium sp. 34-64-41]HQT89432.1 plasmid replication protein RepC [Acidiphilium sp.]
MDTGNRMSVCGRHTAHGLRKITPPMLQTMKNSGEHTFISEMLPGQVLAIFKAAAPYLGIRPNVVHAVDWLFRFTNPLDWQPSSRPIVWPSAAMQQEAMGLGASQVKNLNRHLVELGLVVMKDSPNGKRYGRRGPQGRIIEAYGFDLSPIAGRFAEFQAIAQAGREERTRVSALKRRTTIARNGIRQLLQTADEQGITGEEWEAYCSAATMASRGVASRRNSDEMEKALATLEAVQCEMRQYLEKTFNRQAKAPPSVSESSVDIDPKEPENWPHITTTKYLINPKDTVIAQEEIKVAALAEPTTSQPTKREKTITRSRGIKNSHGAATTIQTDPESFLKITPTELMKLAPRMKPYLRDTMPRWAEIVDAADWLREELGISKSIWGDACLAMGREQAAIAIAIVSAKPQSHFRRSPGAYFNGMVSRAKKGELHLARTIWGMRAQH